MSMKWVQSISWGRLLEDPNAGTVNARAIPFSCTDLGIQYVQFATDQGAIAAFEPDSDGVTDAAITGLPVSNANYLFNGSTFDRERANTQLTILASAARTASTDSADFTNYNARGGHFIVDVTAIGAAPSITPTIETFDAASGKYYPVLIGPAISVVSTTVLKVYPGLSEVPDNVAGDILPRVFRLSVTHGNSDSITYSIGANLVL